MKNVKAKIFRGFKLSRRFFSLTDLNVKLKGVSPTSDSFTALKNRGHRAQGDRIGRIFPYWVTIYFG
jgi:hypothetical protein